MQQARIESELLVKSLADARRSSNGNRQQVVRPVQLQANVPPQTMVTEVPPMPMPVLPKMNQQMQNEIKEKSASLQSDRLESSEGEKPPVQANLHRVGGPVAAPPARPTSPKVTVKLPSMAAGQGTLVASGTAGKETVSPLGAKDNVSLAPKTEALATPKVPAKPKAQIETLDKSQSGPPGKSLPPPVTKTALPPVLATPAAQAILASHAQQMPVAINAKVASSLPTPVPPSVHSLPQTPNLAAPLPPPPAAAKSIGTGVLPQGPILSESVKTGVLPPPSAAPATSLPTPAKTTVPPSSMAPPTAHKSFSSFSSRPSFGNSSAHANCPPLGKFSGMQAPGGGAVQGPSLKTGSFPTDHAPATTGLLPVPGSQPASQLASGQGNANHFPAVSSNDGKQPHGP